MISVGLKLNRARYTIGCYIRNIRRHHIRLEIYKVIEHFLKLSWEKSKAKRDTILGNINSFFVTTIFHPYPVIFIIWFDTRIDLYRVENSTNLRSSSKWAILPEEEFILL